MTALAASKHDAEMAALRLAETRLLVVGLGGLGSPATLALAASGVGHFTLLDDDVVDETNLHRQTLFTARDIGRPKVEAAAERLHAVANAAGYEVDVATAAERLLPDNAVAYVRAHDLVLEGADNFATKFLVADAATVAGVPSVQAGAVRWDGWALATKPGQSACLRCVFEDIPDDRVDTCAEAGVVGAVVGVIGGIEAGLAVALRLEQPPLDGVLFSFAGQHGRLRRRRIRRRSSCRLCSGEIDAIRAEQYSPRTRDVDGGP